MWSKMSHTVPSTSHFAAQQTFAPKIYTWTKFWSFICPTSILLTSIRWLEDLFNECTAWLWQGLVASGTDSPCLTPWLAPSYDLLSELVHIRTLKPMLGSPPSHYNQKRTRDQNSTLRKSQSSQSCMLPNYSSAVTRFSCSSDCQLYLYVSLLTHPPNTILVTILTILRHVQQRLHPTRRLNTLSIRSLQMARWQVRSNHRLPSRSQ